jgi:hypothetical protein
MKRMKKNINQNIEKIIKKNLMKIKRDKDE